MMKFSQLSLLLLLIIFLFGACVQNNNSEKQKLVNELENAYKNVATLQEKAQNDTLFAKSDEYRKSMEKIQIEISKKTALLNSNDKLLIRFEAETKLLKNFSDELKSNPGLSTDAEFMRMFKNKANEVRMLYQTLKVANLNDDQKKLFDNLNKQ